MPQTFTYPELLEQMSSYAVRPDAAYLAQRPTFIALAENRIATDMKQLGFQTVVTGTLPTAATMAKPAFWRETIAFHFTDADGKRQPILLRGYDYCRNYDTGTTPGTPKFYADYNFANWLLTPIPDDAYPFELQYYARLEPLSDVNQTNWLTVNMPQALLYACMLESAIWQRNEGEIAKWQSLYGTANGAALAENSERLIDRNLAVTRG